jgi:GNAT superfamily N-acetyltransferase
LIKSVWDGAYLSEALDRIRASGAAPVTNLFARPEKIESWIARGSLSLLQSEGALLLLRQDHGFKRIYHCAAHLEALDAALHSAVAGLATSGEMTVDLVGRSADLEPVVSIYRRNNFSDHNQLIRMVSNFIPEEVPQSEPEVEFAEAEDTAAVAAFLGRLLDPYTDQIPDENEIREAAVNRNILLARRGEAVVGLLHFEIAGLTSHVRYWYVDSSARNQGIGGGLIRQYFRLSAGSKRLILWVVGDNSDSIAKYSHYGFRPDTLVDRIMIRR